MVTRTSLVVAFVLFGDVDSSQRRMRLSSWGSGVLARCIAVAAAAIGTGLIMVGQRRGALLVSCEQQAKCAPCPLLAPPPSGTHSLQRLAFNTPLPSAIIGADGGSPLPHRCRVYVHLPAVFPPRPDRLSIVAMAAPPLAVTCFIALSRSAAAAASATTTLRVCTPGHDGPERGAVKRMTSRYPPASCLLQGCHEKNVYV